MQDVYFLAPTRECNANFLITVQSKAYTTYVMQSDACTCSLIKYPRLPPHVKMGSGGEKARLGTSSMAALPHTVVSGSFATRSSQW